MKKIITQIAIFTLIFCAIFALSRGFMQGAFIDLAKQGGVEVSLFNFGHSQTASLVSHPKRRFLENLPPSGLRSKKPQNLHRNYFDCFYLIRANLK